MKLKSCTDWFNVREFRSMDDPSGQLQRKELLVPLNAYPADFGLGPNPREPKMTSKVSKRIGETLDEDSQNFHLLNRGITIVAKDIQFDNQSKRVRLSLNDSEEEEEYYGILDGGNTNAQINLWRDNIEDDDLLAKSYVNVQILLPMTNGDDPPRDEMLRLLNEVKEARNTSVQVTEKSLADARHHFDLLKKAVAGEPYADSVIWHEGAHGNVDALDIVSLLMVAYPRYTNDSGGNEPHLIYGHKIRALDAFLKYTADQPEELARWIRIVPSLVMLFDELQVKLPAMYEGKFGRITGVKIHDEGRYVSGDKNRYSKTPFKSKFLGRQMKYRYGPGFVYPVFAGFRVLLKADESTGEVNWKKDPLEFWKNHGENILKQFKPHMDHCGFESKKIGQSPTCYQAVRQAITGYYKDELLIDAGIEV